MERKATWIADGLLIRNVTKVRFGILLCDVQGQQCQSNHHCVHERRDARSLGLNCGFANPSAGAGSRSLDEHDILSGHLWQLH